MRNIFNREGRGVKAQSMQSILFGKKDGLLSLVKLNAKGAELRRKVCRVFCLVKRRCVIMEENLTAKGAELRRKVCKVFCVVKKA